MVGSETDREDRDIANPVFIRGLEFLVYAGVVLSILISILVGHDVKQPASVVTNVQKLEQRQNENGVKNEIVPKLNVMLPF